MDVHYPTISERATPQYVLAVLQDLIRQDEDLADLELTFKTTVADVFFLAKSCLVGKFLNNSMGITIDDEEWSYVLEPPDERTLRDVCDLIARYMPRPRIQPARVAGVSCLPAGAFLTIRSLLHQAGAKGEDIGPSTPLAPFVKQFKDVFLGPIARLAPGALPQTHVEYSRASKSAAIDFCLGLFFLGISFVFRSDWFGIAGCFMMLEFAVKAWLAEKWLGPSIIKFGELTTFRDLAILLADQADA